MRTRSPPRLLNLRRHGGSAWRKIWVVAELTNHPSLDRRPPMSGATRLAAVIGDPVRHSLSPTLLGAAFAETGLDWTYVALEVAEGAAETALDGMRALGIAGLSVTMPHKAAMAVAVDRCTNAAAALGAVNCVVADAGSLVGHNTDGGGFLDGLARDAGIDLAGRPVVVLGAGGGGREPWCAPWPVPERPT